MKETCYQHSCPQRDCIVISRILRSFSSDFIYIHSGIRFRYCTSLSYRSARNLHSLVVARIWQHAKPNFTKSFCALSLSVNIQPSKRIDIKYSSLPTAICRSPFYIIIPWGMSCCCSCRVTRSAFTTRSLTNLPIAMFQNILYSKPSSSESRLGCEGNWLGVGVKVSHKACGAWWNKYLMSSLDLLFQGNWFPQLWTYVSELHESKHQSDDV